LSRGKGKILVEEHPSPITAHLPTHALLIFASLRSIHHPPIHLNYSSMTKQRHLRCLFDSFDFDFHAKKEGGRSTRLKIARPPLTATSGGLQFYVKATDTL
jgi:hypothetical protein